MTQVVHTLEAVFGDIARTRMAGLPIVNTALLVEAVGFREWQGHWAGVLVTPWSINLVLLPGEDAALAPLALDEKATWDFPSGSYEFIGLNEPVIGACHICSLISPVLEFAEHDEARSVAQEIIHILFAESAGGAEVAALEETRLKGEGLGQKGMSRRDFLRMAFTGR